jgi:hypothetical protein
MSPVGWLLLFVGWSVVLPHEVTTSAAVMAAINLVEKRCLMDAVLSRVHTCANPAET